MTLVDTISDVWPLESLTDEERDLLNTQCCNLQTMYILAALAVPDMLESIVPLARSFEEVEKLTVDTWGSVAIDSSSWPSAPHTGESLIRASRSFLSVMHEPSDPASGVRR